MARYIDAEKAVEEARLSYCKDCNSYNGVRCSACAFDDAMSYIEDAPSVDVVEVVRCKNCKHFKSKGTEFLVNDIFGNCEKSSTGLFDDGEEVYGNDFCSYGERRTDDD